MEAIEDTKVIEFFDIDLKTNFGTTSLSFPSSPLRPWAWLHKLILPCYRVGAPHMMFMRF